VGVSAQADVLGLEHENVVDPSTHQMQRCTEAREAAADDENLDVGLHGTLLSSRLNSALSKTIARTYLFSGAGRTAFARSRPTKAARARCCQRILLTF